MMANGLIIGLLFLAMTMVVRGAMRAKAGYEDDKGFHFGDDRRQKIVSSPPPSAGRVDGPRRYSSPCHARIAGLYSRQRQGAAGEILHDGSRLPVT